MKLTTLFYDSILKLFKYPMMMIESETHRLFQITTQHNDYDLDSNCLKLDKIIPLSKQDKENPGRITFPLLDFYVLILKL